MSETDTDVAKVAELIGDIRIAMLTTVAPDGRLVSHPMATQDSDFDGTIRFIGERRSQKVTNLEANPQVNVAFTGSGSSVSLSGTARVVLTRPSSRSTGTPSPTPGSRAGRTTRTT